jgi:GNAT superfamily N-acetyltransferase
METRVATNTDLEVVTRLMNEFHSTPSNMEDLRPWLEKIVDSTRSDVLLVLDETNLVQGMAIVDLIYKLPKVECRVNEVVVSSEARGKGYGEVIMKAAEEWAWTHDADMIEFSSRPSREAANTLYQKIGYNLRDTNVYSKNREV